MAETILARRGPASGLPTLDVGELGWLTDQKVLAVGDGTSTPPRVLTSKTTALMDYTAAAGVKLKTVHALKTDSSLSAVSIVLPATDNATNTGLYSPAVDQVGVVAGGVLAATFSATLTTFARNSVFATTGYTRVARGDTSQRAVTGTPGGELRFNTQVGTYGSLEVAGTNGMWFTVYTSGLPNGYGGAGGTANAITVTLDSAPAAYTNGMEALVRIASANTGAATINVNGLGAVGVFKSDGSTLTGGEMITGMIARLVYDPGLSGFQLTNAAAASSEGGNSSGGSTDEAQLTVKFTTRADVQAGDVALLFADGTIAPTTVARRDSIVNPIHQDRDLRYKNVKTVWTPDNVGQDYEPPNSSYLQPRPVYGTPMAQLTSGRFVTITTIFNSELPQATIYDSGGNLIKNIVLDVKALYNSTSNGTQIHVVALSGGGFAVSWSIWSSALPNSFLRCRYAVYDADGVQVSAPADVGNVATTTTANSGFGQRAVRMVALTGGGFAIFYTYAHESGSSTARTMLACTYNAAGVQQGSTLTLATHANTINGPTFGVTGNPGPIHDNWTDILQLPNGNWAVCWIIDGTPTSGEKTLHHAIIAANGALVGTVNVFNNALLSSHTPLIPRMCADAADGSFYIAFTTGATSQAIVLAKFSATNVYDTKVDLAADSSDVISYAIVTITGGGVVLFATRAYQTTSSPASPFVPNSLYINAITFNASLVQQSTKSIPNSMPDGQNASSNYNPRLYAFTRADGGYVVVRYPGQSSGFYGYYCFLDSAFNVVRLLNMQNSGLTGLDPKLRFLSTCRPGEFVAHPDTSTVKVMPIFSYGDDNNGNIIMIGTQLIADLIEARTIAGVVQADKNTGQQADVTIRGPVSTRLNFGAGFTFNYRGASEKIVGNTGWFMSTKGMLGGPQKAGVEIKRAVRISIDSYRSYRVPRGCRLEGWHYTGQSMTQIAINGVYLPSTSGITLNELRILANEGDVISSSQLLIIGYLISG